MNGIDNAMSRERLDYFIDEAAKGAGYVEGFGVTGCDLVSRRDWWVAYCRQSSKEQSQNDRIADYLLI